MTASPPFAVSVIIPAFNAGETIATTLDSIVGQTDPSWEAVVIDDGSSDRTASVVEAYAAREPRIRLRRQPNAGPSVARNLGIEVARYDWILFLDADDWVDAALLQSVRERLELAPDLDVVHYGWTRLWSDGRIIDHGMAGAESDLFPALATYCAFMIHAAVTRRALIVRAGCFDRTLFAAEDWLLWQRIARLGARFGRVDARLAFYRYTLGSLSTDLDRMTKACLHVFRLGHGPDPALALAEGGTHRLGATDESRRHASVVLVCWLAGAHASRGRDPVDLVESVPDDGLVADPMELAVGISESFPLALSGDGSWPEMWNRVGSVLRPFLEALERKLHYPNLARSVTQRLERAVALRAAFATETVGRTSGRAIDVTKPIDDVEAPGADRLVVRLEATGEAFGDLDLPVIDGRVSAWVVADAIADRFAWVILGWFLRVTRYRDVEFQCDPDGWSAWRGSVRLLGGLPEASSDRFFAWHDRVGWEYLLEEVWGAPSADAPVGVASDSIQPVEISDTIPAFRSERPTVIVEARLGGAPMALLEVPVTNGVTTPAIVRAVIGDAVGYELCRVAVREGLIGRSLDDGESLRSRLLGRAKAVARLDPPFESWSHLPAPEWQIAVARALGGEPGLVVGRRPHSAIGTAADRRASIPLAAVERIKAAELRAGTPVVERAGGPPRHVRYSPELFPPRPRAWTAFAEATNCGSTRTDALPILMYHRVARTGHPDRDRWRMTPERFETQLKLLRDAGFESATFDEWGQGAAARRSLPGRRVTLTFDDGFADFATVAWPLLKAHGFKATVFLVTGSVGRWNTWDEGGEVEPLMCWDTILRLRDEGVEFGGHSVTHTDLSLLPPERIFAEAFESRATIEERLRMAVTAFAYPYGEHDGVVRHLVGAAGFSYGVTCRVGRATWRDPLLALPRIEVYADADPAEPLVFAR